MLIVFIHFELTAFTLEKNKKLPEDNGHVAASQALE